MANKIKKPKKKLDLPRFNSKTLYLEPVTSSEIIKVILNLSNKAGGVDKINVKILKSIVIYITEPLEHIFNLCIIKSIWPNILKTAEIIPIYKNSDKTNAANYRPISLISNIAKVFEKIIHKRLINFLNVTGVLSPMQFGFRKNISTNDALNFINNNIYNNLNKGIKTIATFLDLSKAFVTVNHAILIKKTL